MEGYYANEAGFMEGGIMCHRDMDSLYGNQAYIDLINGCLTLDGNINFADYASYPTTTSCFENNYNPNYLPHNNDNTHNQSLISSPNYRPYVEEFSSPGLTTDSPAYENQFYLGEGGGPGPYAQVPDLEFGGACKAEPHPELPLGFNVGFFPAQKGKGKAKKISGQPSKNLMAERRRRKRLNDRLSMLRSVVPKISKMDRTSILGDTIDYVKELTERINGLQREMNLSSDELSSMSIFNDVKPSEIVVRNSPKFDVERRKSDTRMEICCGGKPGLLLSTVTTLEALGLDIQQCVISCFNEFSLQASCSEEFKKRAMLDSEDIRQALMRNAGYGKKCL